MKKITSIAALLLSMVAFTQQALITGYVDSPCPNASGRVLEIYIDGTINLEGWAVQRQSNGNGYSTNIDISTFGIISDSFIYLTNDDVTLTSEFGITTNILKNASINSNGNDAFQIVDPNLTVIDRFGEENVDGNGTAWAHEDSYYLRNNFSAANGGDFNPSNWTFGDLQILDGRGLCNSLDALSTIVSFGSYVPPVIITNVQFSTSFASISEDGGEITISLEVSQSPIVEGTVDVNLVAGGTALEGTDFTFSGSKTVTFPEGSSTTQTITIPIINNTTDGSDLFFALSLSNATNIEIVGNNLFSVYILDDDTVVPTENKSELSVNYLSSYLVDAAGTAEITAYDSQTQRLFVTNTGSIEVLDFSDPTNISSLATIDITPFGGSVQSVAVSNGILAAAIAANDPTEDGFVVFADINGNNFVSVQVGSLPDMLVFSPDGKKLLTANEGQPNDEYTVDPEGSISIIDVSGGLAGISQANVTTLNFNAYDGQEAVLRAAGIRIYGPNASVSQDLEPEYIAVSEDSQMAYVTLQENNAYAIVDLSSMEITDIISFGRKDHSLPENSLDTSDETNFIFNASWPIKGLYMPDAVSYYSVNGVDYIVTANEGDSRDYSGYAEERKLKDSDYILDPAIFSNQDLLKLKTNLGDINVTAASGDNDGDGLYEEIHVFGGRSFSIFEAATGNLIYDSGNDFEVVTAADPVYGAIFNASNENNNLKNRSDNKGPEPEGILVKKLGDQTYAFILLERVGGMMVYNITDPTNPVFLQYVNSRGAVPGEPAGGDLGPEGVAFVDAADSPTGKALVILSNEVSASLSIFSLDNVSLSVPEFASNSDFLFKMYPNPAGNIVFFSKPGNYTVYDLLGRLVKTTINEASIKISTLKSGTYVVKNPEGISQKLIVR